MCRVVRRCHGLGAVAEAAEAGRAVRHPPGSDRERGERAAVQVRPIDAHERAPLRGASGGSDGLNHGVRVVEEG